MAEALRAGVAEDGGGAEVVQVSVQRGEVRLAGPAVREVGTQQRELAVLTEAGELFLQHEAARLLADLGADL